MNLVLLLLSFSLIDFYAYLVYAIASPLNIKAYGASVVMEPINLKIGEKLKSIRTTRTLSLDDVAALTGVSKPMLGQIERGQSIPTVTTLWKIATGLKTPFSYFLEGQQAEYTVVSPDQANVILGNGGKMRAYPLFTYDPVRSVETFYIEFDPGCRHSSDKHNDGVEEHIFVLRGALRLVLGDKTIDVGERQAVRFRADMPHAYQNLSESECTVYNTIFYPSH